MQPYSIVAGSAYPTLGLAAVQLGTLKAAPPILEEKSPRLRIGKGRFDLSDDGNLRFVASKPKAQEARTISAADVLSGKVTRERLAGRIVFVGSSLPSFGGLRATASMPLEPSVQIHADLANGLLEGRLPQRVSWASRYEALYVLVCGLIVSLAAARLRPVGLAATGIALIGLTLALTFAVYTFTSLLLDGMTAALPRRPFSPWSPVRSTHASGRPSGAPARVSGNICQKRSSPDISMRRDCAHGG